MKIFDCFTFNNELDLLELRLREMSPAVDKFVIVESPYTFQGNAKPLHFQDNRDRFAPWMDKIIHVVVDDMPNDGNAWHNEHHQRNSIVRGLRTADPEDIAIISDCDEILRASSVELMRRGHSAYYGFRIPYFNFKLNYLLVEGVEVYHVWATAAQVRTIGSLESFRNNRFLMQRAPYGHSNANFTVLEHSGWHFTYLGDTQGIRDKIKSFAHTELNKPEVLEQIDVAKMIEKGVGFNPTNPLKFKKVRLDDYFPACVTDGSGLFSQHILTDADSNVRDFLPKA